MTALGRRRRVRPPLAGVCHVTTSHPPGDTRILLRECATLAASGYDVELIVVANDASPRPDLEDASGVAIHLRRFPIPGRLPRLLLRPFFGVWLALSSRRRVIHVHDPEMIVVAPLLKLAGRSVVYDVHEDVPRQIQSKTWLPRLLRPVIARCFELIENWSTARADLVVTATDAIGDRFDDLHPRVHRVRNFASFEQFGPPTPIADRPWDACFVGVINEVRGIEQMRAVVERAGARVVFAGPCHPPSLASQLTELSDAQPDFEYRGAVPHPEAVQIMGSSKLGLLLFQPEPNHVTSQPNKLFEYMASGTPVVGSNFPLWTELIEGHQAGVVVDPTSSDDAVAAVSELLGDVRRIEYLSAKARRAFQAEFSWDSEAAELLKAYASLPIPAATTGALLL